MAFGQNNGAIDYHKSSRSSACATVRDPRLRLVEVRRRALEELFQYVPVKSTESTVSLQQVTKCLTQSTYWQKVSS